MTEKLSIMQLPGTFSKSSIPSMEPLNNYVRYHSILRYQHPSTCQLRIRDTLYLVICNSRLLLSSSPMSHWPLEIQRIPENLDRLSGLSPLPN